MKVENGWVWPWSFFVQGGIRGNGNTRAKWHLLQTQLVNGRMIEIKRIAEIKELEASVMVSFESLYCLFQMKNG